jgi:hypothetical protein
MNRVHNPGETDYWRECHSCDEVVAHSKLTGFLNSLACRSYVDLVKQFSATPGALSMQMQPQTFQIDVVVKQEKTRKMALLINGLPLSHNAPFWNTEASNLG